MILSRVRSTRCRHPNITTHIKLSRRFVKAKRMKVVKVTEQILAAKKIDGIQEIKVFRILNTPAFYKVTNNFISIIFISDNIIIFCVAGPKEGRGTILVNLSLCMTLSPVVLVKFSDIDYDFYNPQLHGQFQRCTKAASVTLTQSELPTHCCSSDMTTSFIEENNAFKELPKPSTYITNFIFNNLFSYLLSYLFMIIRVYLYKYCIYSNVMLMCWPRPIFSS